MLPLPIENLKPFFDDEAGKLGLEIVEVSFFRMKGRGILTLIADRRGGVTLDECAQLNRKIGFVLEGLSENQDPVIQEACAFLSERYFIEVQSPGLDRPLKSDKDFARNLGYTVRVFYKTPQDKTYELLGKIISYGVDFLEISEEKTGAISKIDRNKIIKVVKDLRFKHN